MGNNDLWDDPEWEDLRRIVNKQPVPKKKPKAVSHSPAPEKPAVEPVEASEEPQKVEVNLKLTLPKVKLPKIPKYTAKQRKMAIIGAGSLVGIVIVGLVVTSVIRKDSDGSGTGAGASKTPPFKTVLPEGKSESTEGEVRYDPSVQVVSYRDTIGNASVTVSQQKLPENFKSNPDEEVKKVAEGFSATEIVRESNPRVYLGNNAEGPQTVIFHKNGLLIFILSSRSLEKYEWVEYILKLK